MTTGSNITASWRPDGSVSVYTDNGDDTVSIENFQVGDAGYDAAAALVLSHPHNIPGSEPDPSTGIQYDPRLILVQFIKEERDNRIDRNLVFQGNAYDYDPASRERISGAAALAGFAVMQGAEPGDYRWNGASADFSWRDKNNFNNLMDAQTMFAFGQTAAEHVRAHIFAAVALKEMAEIPEDYFDDKYWP